MQRVYIGKIIYLQPIFHISIAVEKRVILAIEIKLKENKVADQIQKFINSYEKTFAQDIKQRSEELELAEEVANLGAAVIEKGAQKLIKRAGLEFEELENSNMQLSKRIKERIAKIDDKISNMPSRVRSKRQHRLLMAQDISSRKKTEGPLLNCIEI